jgi:histidinol-phosphate aminotransferase
VLALYEAAQAVKPTLVIVDEAYGEFSHRPSLLPLIEGRPLLVVTRTMSKAFGAAGPYHLSAVTQATALAALEFTDTLLGYVELLKAERDRIVTELRSMGLDVTDSDANFVQFGRFDDAHAMWQAILDRGVLVRDNGVPGRLRVTAGTPAENDAFLDAVRTSLKES